MIRFAPKPSSLPHEPENIAQSLTKRMADDIRELAFADENVSVETLRLRDYSDEEIALYSPQAVALARRQSIRQIAGA